MVSPDEGAYIKEVPRQTSKEEQDQVQEWNILSEQRGRIFI